jgi:hypothetical protein
MNEGQGNHLLEVQISRSAILTRNDNLAGKALAVTAMKELTWGSRQGL